jgi:hypothetical protein
MDRPKKYRTRIGLHIDAQQQDGYFKVTAYPVTIGKTVWEQQWTEQHPNEEPRSYREIHDETIRNAGDDIINGLRLDCLRVSGLGSNDHTPRHLFAWDVEYKDVYSVDARRAAKMAHTLKTIDARLEKHADKYGRPATFGQYVARVADAIGADAIVFVRDAETATGWHNRDRHLILDTGAGASRIDARIREWVDAGTPQATV